MELTNKEMQNVTGGFSFGIFAGLASALVFFVGLASGYTNPTSCNN